MKNIMSLIGAALALGSGGRGADERNPPRLPSQVDYRRPATISRAERAVRKKAKQRARASRKANR